MDARGPGKRLGSGSLLHSRKIEKDRKKTGETIVYEELQKENEGLLKELSDIKGLHNQLLHENPRENISMQRVNILKTQIFQLERQMMALTNTVNGYARTNVDVLEMCQGLVERMKSGSISSEDVLKSVMQMQSRLSRPSRGAARDHALPLLFMDNFIKNGSKGKADDGLSNVMGGIEHVPSLLDVCSGRMDHVNMRKVGILETKLARLYGELTRLQLSLAAMPAVVPTLFEPVAEHQLGHMTSAIEVLSECCHDLMCLSLLVPAAPWSRNGQVGVSKELSPAEVIKNLPPGVRSRKEVRDSVEGVCKYFAHVHEMQSIKVKALDEELDFHKSVYHLHVEYVRTLITAMKEGYKKFETSAQDCFCKPLSDILKRYEAFDCTSNCEDLKELLASLKRHSPQLKSAVEDLSRMDSNGGAETISSFEENFFQDLNQLERKYCKKSSEMTISPTTPQT